MQYTEEEVKYYLNNHKYIDNKIDSNDYINSVDRSKDAFALLKIDEWLNSMSRVNKEMIELKFFKNNRVRNELERKLHYSKTKLYKEIKFEINRLLAMLND